jgi:hypothetical protein
MVRPPVKLIGHANDWVIYTKDQDMSIVQNNLLYTNTIADWMKNLRIKIGNSRVLDVRRDHKKWPHTGLSAGTKWGAVQGTLLRVHEIMILSSLAYWSVAYGSARQSELKRLKAIHNKKCIAFCICRTENILCESGFVDLTDRR